MPLIYSEHVHKFKRFFFPAIILELNNSRPLTQFLIQGKGRRFPRKGHVLFIGSRILIGVTTKLPEWQKAVNTDETRRPILIKLVSRWQNGLEYIEISILWQNFVEGGISIDQRNERKKRAVDGRKEPLTKENIQKNPKYRRAKKFRLQSGEWIKAIM